MICSFYAEAEESQDFGGCVHEDHEDLEDIGAKLALNKSVDFSTDAATRDCLGTHRWSDDRLL